MLDILDSEKTALELVYTGERERKFQYFSHFTKALGTIVSKGFAHLQKTDFDTNRCVPYYIFKVELSREPIHMEFVGIRYESEQISLAKSEKRFQGQSIKRNYGIIGYDTEFKMIDATNLKVG